MSDSTNFEGNENEDPKTKAMNRMHERIVEQLQRIRDRQEKSAIDISKYAVNVPILDPPEEEEEEEEEEEAETPEE
jgi:hypothetical protein